MQNERLQNQKRSNDAAFIKLFTERNERDAVLNKVKSERDTLTTKCDELKHANAELLKKMNGLMGKIEVEDVKTISSNENGSNSSLIPVIPVDNSNSSNQPETKMVDTA